MIVNLNMDLTWYFSRKLGVFCLISLTDFKSIEISTEKPVK
jgi:hypothetical protein